MSFKNILISGVIVFFCFKMNAQVNYPGGVTNSKIWYKSEHTDLQVPKYTDYSENNIVIENCGEVQEGLFNFNPSIESGSLCLTFKLPLESVNKHNFFIVSDPVDNDDSYRHLSSTYRDFFDNFILPSTFVDSINRNALALETQQGFASKMIQGFSQHQNTHVHFYSWSNYDIDRKFKSFGEVGETQFDIGKHIVFPDLDDGLDFSGLMPEFVLFDRQLTDNERNRVESYLGLKYGITLKNRHYKNSKNKIFWDTKNNQYFKDNIFGIGKDDISGLNQLQCESAHHRDFLVAATNDIQIRNADVNFNLLNNNFIVFGDTNLTGLQQPNNQNLKVFNRVWLAQITGEDEIRTDTPIHFRLDISDLSPSFIDELESGDKVLWMLHDRYVDHSYVSDFNNGNIEYYKPDNIDFSEKYAHYKPVYFDEDHNRYDQYTFAIGPDVIIQVSYEQWQCEGECFTMIVEVIGGEPEDDVVVLDPEGNPYNLELIGTEGNTVTYVTEEQLCANEEDYIVDYNGTNGYQTQYNFPVQPLDYTLDLGSDLQFLTAQNNPIVLDAGSGINDPDATYQWYYNGVLIDHNESTLDATQPGTYEVIVTTSNMACQLSDVVEVVYEFSADIIPVEDCNEEKNSIQILNITGTPPFVTSIVGSGLNVNHAHQGDETFTDIPLGTYTVTVTDALSGTYSETITIGSYGYSNGSLGPDQTLSFNQQQIILDAVSVFSNPNFTFQWKYNGVFMSYTQPQITIDKPGVYTVVVYDPVSGCSAERSITIKHEMKVIIKQESDCEESSNGVEVIIDYGLPDYTVTIQGNEYPSGNQYTLNQSSLSGSITISGIPYGSYTVTVQDDYGGIFQQPMDFEGLILDLDQQLADLCQQCGNNCTIEQDACSNYDRNPPLYALLDHYQFGQCLNTFTLDASLLLNNNNNVNYEWYLNNVNLNHFASSLTFDNSLNCKNEYPYILDENYFYCEIYNVKVIITDRISGCSKSEIVGVSYGYCPVLGGNPQPRSGGNTFLTTKIYPNPSDSGATFYYDISADEGFEATVELYSVTGSKIKSVEVNGNSNYTLPFNALASGLYFIRTITKDGSVKFDKVIIN